jgi:predicted RNA-binding protein Jag
MDVEGAVRAGVHEGSDLVEVFIDSPSARHLVGRRGITLHAIRHLLEAAMSAEHGSWRFDISVDGGDRGPRDERFDERPRRDDRGERSERPRRDDRGDRPRRDDRGGDRGGDRRDDRRASDRDIDKLRTLARRLAEEARDTGKPVRFRKEMNSYERRMVHMELQDFPGVRTESEGDGQLKTIVILPAGAAPAEE